MLSSSPLLCFQENSTKVNPEPPAILTSIALYHKCIHADWKHVENSKSKQSSDWLPQSPGAGRDYAPSVWSRSPSEGIVSDMHRCWSTALIFAHSQPQMAARGGGLNCVLWMWKHGNPGRWRQHTVGVLCAHIFKPEEQERIKTNTHSCSQQFVLLLVLHFTIDFSTSESI